MLNTMRTLMTYKAQRETEERALLDAKPGLFPRPHVMPSTRPGGLAITEECRNPEYTVIERLESRIHFFSI